MDHHHHSACVCVCVFLMRYRCSSLKWITERRKYQKNEQKYFFRTENECVLRAVHVVLCVCVDILQYFYAKLSWVHSTVNELLLLLLSSPLLLCRLLFTHRYMMFKSKNTILSYYTAIIQTYKKIRSKMRTAYLPLLQFIICLHTHTQTHASFAL